MAVKLVATSDWHLDVSTAGVDRFEDTGEAIDRSVDVAKAMKADVYLMGGDLSDPNMRALRSVTKALQVQRECNLAGICPLFVAGNHDVIEDGSGYTTLSPLRETGVGHVFESPQVVELQCGITVIALPFTASSHEYSPDEFIRACKVDSDGPLLIVGHLNLEGIGPGSETKDMPRGRDVFWPLDAIAECFPNALLVGGHYHAPQEFKGVHIIGSTARLRFDEANNETGYLVMEV